MTNFLDAGYKDTFREMHPSKKEFTYWLALSRAKKLGRGQRRDYFIVSKSLYPKVVESRIIGE